MRIGLVMRALHRSETALANDFRAVADRHATEHEVHHVARDLASWSETHVRRLTEAAGHHHVNLGGEAPFASPDVPAAERYPESELPLLADLRWLYGRTAEVAVDWELLSQGAQALRYPDLLALAGSCRARTLRQLTWVNSVVKSVSPQILAT